MKKLLIFLAFIVMFTGCTPQQSGGEAVPSPSVSPSPEKEFIHVANATNYINAEKIKILNNLGVYVDVLGKTGEKTRYLCLEKGDNQLMIEYDSEDPITLNYWGSHIIVVKSDRLEYYFIDDLHHVDTFVVSDFSGRIIDAIPHGHGFMAIYVDGDEYGFAEFKANGGFMYKLPLPLENPFVNDDGEIVKKTYLTYLDKNKYYTDQSQKKILFTIGSLKELSAENSSFIYDLSDNTAHYVQSVADLSTELGEVFVAVPIKEEDSDSIDTSITAKAFIQLVGEPTGYVEFDSGILDTEFIDFKYCNIEYTGESKAVFTVDGSDCAINIDFAKRKASSNYSRDMAKNNLQWIVAKSSNDRYSLWSSDGGSGGDAIVEKIYLVDNHTGKTKYLDTIGGMYGGNAGCGFFSNGDIYTIMLDEFKVFTTDMSQQGPVFEMSKNFPLGDNAIGDGTYRRLLSARRDPATHSWAVLYHAGKYHEVYEDDYVDYDKLSDNFFNSTYKIGILDQQGNLTKTYETGEYVMSYWFRGIKMHMETGDILYFSVLNKGITPQLEAKIDLKTGEYTCISGGYNNWGNQ